MEGGTTRGLCFAPEGANVTNVLLLSVKPRLVYV